MKRMLQSLAGLTAAGFLALTSAWGQSSYAKPYTFTTIAGTAGINGSRDGTNGVAQFYWPEGIAVDTNDNLYVVDNFENTVRKVAPVGTNWVVTTIAGTAGANGSGDGTNGAAQFYEPTGIAIDGSGNLYVADAGNNTVRKVVPMGTNWVVTTIAGQANSLGGSADGTNQAALFNYPSGIVADGSGNLFVADTSNNTIRKLTPVGTNWVVSTIAGTANSSGGNADGTNQAAQFNGPSGVALDSAGNVYVTDTSNDSIRMLTPAGTNWVVTTIAGTGNGSADGSGQNAQFYLPYGIAADTNGNLYVADTYNDTVRIIAPVGTNWVVNTLAGVPGVTGGSDGIVWNAQFNYPFGITADGAGRLFVGDTLNGTIRLGLFTPVPNPAVSLAGPAGVVVSWPGAASFYTLQTNADLTTPNWVDYGGTAVNTNGLNSVTLPQAAGNLFFRLSE